MDDMVTNKDLNLAHRMTHLPGYVMDTGFKILVAATVVLLVGFGGYTSPSGTTTPALR